MVCFAGFGFDRSSHTMHCFEGQSVSRCVRFVFESGNRFVVGSCFTSLKNGAGKKRLQLVFKFRIVSYWPAGQGKEFVKSCKECDSPMLQLKARPNQRVMVKCTHSPNIFGLPISCWKSTSEGLPNYQVQCLCKDAKSQDFGHIL